MSDWWVLHCKVHKEKVVCSILTTLDCEFYCPRIRKNKPKASFLGYPFFPGYIFVNTSPEKNLMGYLKWIPFSYGLVSFGDEPAVVAQVIVDRIQTELAVYHKILDSADYSYTKGEIVTVQIGESGKYEGIFDTYISGEKRARILIKYLGNLSLKVETNVINIYPKISIEQH